MKFTSSLLAIAATFFAASSVSAAPLDVWDPTITSPVAGTVWTIGTQVNVTWSTADKPAQVSNGGEVVLAENQIEIESLSPIFDLAAADGFYTVTVPNVAPGDNYQIVLFGDSGNIGPSFSIVAPSS
ncbi:hypothetical protein GYMLUDRAFT_242470 [Collybiopsis luxurians FD-317 M1]|uniref:Yeast cell wall synthesis Kre9/Knh1-like N-terminal domain-containing protein n=1 Tax=Collybiopsis luxurians FD-317 M1 TaxID=944289 RepID=A0A0D0CJ94_9AGAR|nr:hypothetical protein GYMLUDRAFT_242470 [Collybiopsis luxurians FD-317 M1]